MSHREKIKNSPPPAALTIAGSDSGGGAGIQADLRTFSALDIVGTSAITCVTAQNPGEVTGIAAIDPDMVSLQIKTVCKGFHVTAAKTGMLYSAAIITAVAKTLAECDIPMLVVDPVMVATCGTRLLREDALENLCSDLLPMATVITPNLSEAGILCGHDVGSIEDMKAAAREIGEKHQTACVVKGGHLFESGARNAECGIEIKEDSELRAPSSESGMGEVADVLFANGEITVFSSLRLDIGEAHGTGCVFSAALTAFLAAGESLPGSVKATRTYMTEYLRNI